MLGTILCKGLEGSVGHYVFRVNLVEEVLKADIRQAQRLARAYFLLFYQELAQGGKKSHFHSFLHLSAFR